MNTVFIKSSLKQDIPEAYETGEVAGPFNKKKCGFQHTLDNLLARPRTPNSIIQSLTTIALAAYIADKSYSRTTEDDSWTRKFKLSVPINPKLIPAIKIVGNTLQFLSGDYWNIQTRDERVTIGAKSYFEDGFKPDAICLFSGGIDSLVGAINLLEQDKMIILISHFESGFYAGVQNQLMSLLTEKYSTDRVRHLSIQVCSNDKEPSTRSRSFLFITLGLMIASAYNDSLPMYIPENGFVGINVPLTGSRQGSLSTRTTHPAFLAGIRNIIQTTDLKHEIINPFTYFSKGEVVKKCKNINLLKRLLPITISCAKTGSLRWRGKTPGTNCGYCYPCLIRRSALHALDMDQPERYAYDVIGTVVGLQNEVPGEDLRCLLQFVSKIKRTKRPMLFEILKTGPLSDADHPGELVKPLNSGYDELLNFITNKGCKGIRRYAGLL